MENKNEVVVLEAVHDKEMDDIWDLFFPYMNEKKEKLRKLNQPEQNKPRRYLRFLTMWPVYISKNKNYTQKVAGITRRLVFQRYTRA